MLTFNQRTDAWNAMMLTRGRIVKEHAKRKELDFLDGLENFGTPILMTYLPLLLLALAVSDDLDVIYLAAVLFSLAATALGIFIASFAFTLMAHMMATFLGGKAKLGKLYYMVSLAAAPTFVFTIVINIAVLLGKSILTASSFPIASIGMLNLAGSAVAVAVTLYGFYLLTVAIDALYGFGRQKAVATWLLPTIVLLVAGAFLFVTVLFDIMGFLVKTL